jgi:hypothetical protein
MFQNWNRRREMLKWLLVAMLVAVPAAADEVDVLGNCGTAWMHGDGHSNVEYGTAFMCAGASIDCTYDGFNQVGAAYYDWMGKNVMAVCVVDDGTIAHQTWLYEEDVFMCFGTSSGCSRDDDVGVCLPNAVETCPVHGGSCVGYYSTMETGTGLAWWVVEGSMCSDEHCSAYYPQIHVNYSQNSWSSGIDSFQLKSSDVSGWGKIATNDIRYCAWTSYDYDTDGVSKLSDFTTFTGHFLTSDQCFMISGEGGNVGLDDMTTYEIHFLHGEGDCEPCWSDSRMVGTGRTSGTYVTDGGETELVFYGSEGGAR